METKTVAVVMSVYNVEKYINEAIRSVIKQDIGFFNIQLILVNDGSTDNSGEICKKYSELYPQNVCYIEKENGGQSSARNYGLEKVNAKYVNFLDPDDTMSLNAFSEVCHFFEINPSVDMVTLPLVYFGAVSGIHGKYKHLGSRNRIIDLVNEPENFILSSAASFYRYDVIRNNRFDEKLATEEDTKFNYEIISDTFKVGYICENGVKYNYRKRFESASNSDIAATGTNESTLLAPVVLFEDLLDSKKELSNMDKELIAYEIRSRLSNIKISKLDNNISNRIISDYRRIISRLDCAFISKSKWLDTIEKKVLFLNLSNRNYGEFVRNGYSSLSDRTVKMVDFRYLEDEDCFSISFLYYNFGEQCIELSFISDETGLILHPNKIYNIESVYDLNIGEFKVDTTHICEFKLKRKKETGSLYFYDSKTQKYFKIHRSTNNHKTQLALGHKDVGPVYKGVGISFSDGLIRIWDDTRREVGFSNKLIEKIAGKNLPGRLYQNQKKWILIYDRPEKAGDNGEALYNYIMENEEESLRERTFYVLNKSCKDFNTLKHKDHVIDFRSEDHLRKFINACTIYSSHNAIQFIYPFDHNDFKYYADLLKYKFIWLQHGVTENDVALAANKYSTQDDIVVTATNWEYKEISSGRYFYSPGDVVKTGFARFDYLTNSDDGNNVILFAPTWRMDLVGSLLVNGHNEPKGNFALSDYYKNYIYILKNEKLIKTLQKNKYRIHFILHPGFTCYEEMFGCINCDCIRVIKMEDFSYSHAISNCKLFVTDYSSTAFDAAYCEKPVIYYQFDEDKFFENHYKKSSWSYRNEGFGPVISDSSDLINKIIEMIEKGCINENKYLCRIRNTFFSMDKNNCKRIMNATRSLCEPLESEDILVALQEDFYLCRKELESLKTQLDEKNENLNNALYCLDETRKSFSYKLGLFLTKVPRLIRSKFLRTNK